MARPRRASPAPPRRRPGAEVAAVPAVAAGGALGTIARYAVAQLVPVRAGGFPWATFWTNLSGSFVLGFLLTAFGHRLPVRRSIRAFATTGFLGGYTTFSTFAVEIDLLLEDGHVAVALAYAVGSLAAAFAAVGAGSALARARHPRLGRAGPGPG